MINAITASNVDIGGLSLHISPGKSPMILCSIAKRDELLCLELQRDW
jgi:hypothetical protein